MALTKIVPSLSTVPEHNQMALSRKYEYDIKLEIIVDYNHLKCGVYTVDMMKEK